MLRQLFSWFIRRPWTGPRARCRFCGQELGDRSGTGSVCDDPFCRFTDWITRR